MTRTDVDYETSDPYAYEWTIAAFEAIKAGTLFREILRHGNSTYARVHGKCPRCHDPVDDRLPLEVVRGVGGTLASENLDVTDDTIPFDVVCNCRETHPKAPDGAAGCGIGFRVELKEGRDG